MREPEAGGSLYIIARAPCPGEVKTRLARAIGDGPATRLYAAFLRDLGHRFASGPFRPRWYVTPAEGWPAIATLLPNGAAWVVREQPEGSLTDRQRHLFRESAANGESPVVLIASDSPQLEVSVVAEAFELLRRHDLVLGPTLDGGYYLIGMRGWHDVLAGATMGHADVLSQVRERASVLGLQTALLPATFDVDEIEDLARLVAVARGRPDLAATRAALAELDLEEELAALA
jgi:uncharacterized protein